MDNFCCFDLEIAKEIPEGDDDWKAHRPLGISCAATLTSGGNLRLWHGAQQADGRLPERMSPEECRVLARFLLETEGRGFAVVTWNGLGFDFDILAEECQDEEIQERLIGLALRHVDVAFAMFCAKGFMVGLDTAAKGMGLEGKLEGMHGDLAPAMWAEGRESQNEVLEYVAQDVRTTKEVYEAISAAGRLKWISRSGKPNVWWLPDYGVLNVDQAIQTPKPDTSWMDNPWPRSKFYGWTGLESPEMGEETEEEPVEEEKKTMKITIPVVPITVNFKTPFPSKLVENKGGQMVRGTVDYTQISTGFTQVPVEVNLSLEVDEEGMTTAQQKALKEQLVILARPFNEAALEGVMYLWRELCKMQDKEE